MRAVINVGHAAFVQVRPDGRKACEKIYRKITEKAKALVKTAEDISATYGMPIVNKRISCLLYTSRCV